MTETEKHQYEVNHASEFLSGSISVFSPEALLGGREEQWAAKWRRTGESSGLWPRSGKRAFLAPRGQGTGRDHRHLVGVHTNKWTCFCARRVAKRFHSCKPHSRACASKIQCSDKLFLLNHSRAPHNSCQLGSGCGGREVISGLAPTLFHLTCRPSSPRLASILESRT